MSFDVRVVAARRLRFLPHRAFVVAKHAIFQGEFTTLRRPRTYSQMLDARNMRTPRPLVKRTADKYTVRPYVADRIGEQYLVPLLQVVERADEIDFDALRPPYVIKATHGADMTLLVREGVTVNRPAARALVQTWLDRDFYRERWRELVYKDLPRRAVVEEFIGDGVTPPSDYKFFMFHGEPAMVVVDQDRFSAHTSTLLSPDWRPLKVSGRFAFAETLPEQPPHYAEMIGVAQKLAADFDFIRVDLYNVDGRIYFGELTHYPGGGIVRLQPREFDLALGELWRNGTPLPARFLGP